VTQMLIQLKHQFDIIAHDADFSRYELLILPDATQLLPETIKGLDAFLRRGGAMLATGTSGLWDAGRRALPQLGIRPEGFSPFTASYVRFGKQIAAGIPDTDHVIYDRGVRVRAASGSEKLAGVVEPYFERSWQQFCSHRQTPPDRISPYAAAVQRKNVGYIPFMVFDGYANHGNLACRWLVEKLLDRLLPEPLIRVKAPAMAEASVTRQGRRMIVHLLLYCPQRRTPTLDIVEDVVPLLDVEVSLKTPRKPARVYLAPQRKPLEFVHAGGRTRVVVPRIDGHAMVVFE
jgi:Beta-galactosidase trimerisation domain